MVTYNDPASYLANLNKQEKLTSFCKDLTCLVTLFTHFPLSLNQRALLFCLFFALSTIVAAALHFSEFESHAHHMPTKITTVLNTTKGILWILLFLAFV